SAAEKHAVDRETTHRAGVRAQLPQHVGVLAHRLVFPPRFSRTVEEAPDIAIDDVRGIVPPERRDLVLKLRRREYVVAVQQLDQIARRRLDSGIAAAGVEPVRLANDTNAATI